LSRADDTSAVQADDEELDPTDRENGWAMIIDKRKVSLFLRAALAIKIR